jgi:hypothetical protein
LGSEPMTASLTKLPMLVEMVRTRLPRSCAKWRKGGRRRRRRSVSHSLRRVCRGL